MGDNKQPSTKRLKLTPVEKEARFLFIIKRIKAGLSRNEIRRQFSETYDLTIRATNYWIRDALNYLTLDETPETKRQTKASILEMYHEQFVAAQSDLMALQSEIDKLDRLVKTRETLTELAQGGDRMAEMKLEFLPEIPFSTKAQLLTMKSKMRSEMFKIMTEIGKVQGCYSPEMPWVNAINTLLDRELITGEMANQILTQVDKINNPPLKQIQEIKD